ncbi:MAG: FKBP-type peptidyl-prolyl cis-trans isomerase [Lachnospiraceae bacterium]|nr:FKBP-type peptidyl-prolyl cis-trans isomerase [Lachnospiraceae bacterium]
MSEEISKSKAKRLKRQEEAQADKRKHSLESVLGWVVGVVIACVIIAVIGLGIYQSATKTVADNNYSEGITADGRVKGANLSKVKDIGLDNLTINYSDIEYTDEEVQTAVDQQCQTYAEFSDDASLEVKDGDTINLDYVGYMDDVEFEGGNTQGNGTELVIGSGSYIDTFEQQLIGAHPGDAVTVNVTFPDPYDNNPDYAGKAARFECTVNSVKVVPEFTDEFVESHLSEYAATADGYRAYVKEQGEKNNIQTYIIGKISDEAVATAPSSYLKHLKSLIKYTDEENYKYINEMYKNYYGSVRYNSFTEYTGMNDADYEKSLKESSTKQAAVDLTYENFFVQHGLTVSEEAYNSVLENYGGQETAVSTYGEAYIQQSAVKQTALNYLVEHATINK